MIMGRVQTGRLDDTLKLFCKMPVRDAICWNTLIEGCLDCRDLIIAEELFRFGQVELIHGHVFKSGSYLSLFICVSQPNFQVNHLRFG
ncbi:hypothetical protein EUGRSUZ_E02289 [Eucalyptus grandis]|uniref:Uncharacterized protein n=2 Tax=Eucalyptus grandis TaxID=71139 RepID=A0ACC3KWR7_EUCGR|nr:hypothetical protein EUGRSUZ_E02289 [Eucalyptus grandis]